MWTRPKFKGGWVDQEYLANSVRAVFRCENFFAYGP